MSDVMEKSSAANTGANAADAAKTDKVNKKGFIGASINEYAMEYSGV